MPGVLILEGMAQTGGILLLNGVDNPGDKLVYFMGINNAKFRKPVLPGDQLTFELEMVSRRSRVCQMKGKAYVQGSLVAEAEMMATIVDRIDTRQTSGGNGSTANAVPRTDPSMN
jgi:UDP-3-O-[3-hydroxymyristoyl] N-acetylglucosamine deacetylase/3-hydroxyacyl-[acyl-carrier-protein] dehydratase